MLLFAAAAATATCVIFGTLPALRSTSVEPLTSLKSGERGVVGNRERFSVQRAMVITQIAVSMVLLVGALLFPNTYHTASQQGQLPADKHAHPKAGDSTSALRAQAVLQIDTIYAVQSSAAESH